MQYTEDDIQRAKAYDPLDWIDENNEIQIEWAFSYIRKQISRITIVPASSMDRREQTIHKLSQYSSALKHNIQKEINFMGQQTSIPDVEKIQAKINKMRSAWRQKKSRQKTSKKSYESYKFDKNIKENMKTVKKNMEQLGLKNLTNQAIVEFCITQTMHNLKVNQSFAANGGQNGGLANEIFKIKYTV